MPSPTPAPTPTTLPLVNGDFEAWPFNDPGTVAGWTVAGNKHIESITQGATSPTHSAGFSVGGDSTAGGMRHVIVPTEEPINGIVPDMTRLRPGCTNAVVSRVDDDTLQVRVSTEGLTVRARKSYLAKTGG